MFHTRMDFDRRRRLRVEDTKRATLGVTCFECIQIKPLFVAAKQLRKYEDKVQNLNRREKKRLINYVPNEKLLSLQTRAPFHMIAK